MAKFKVGDKVRVRTDLKVGSYYYNENRSYRDVFSSGMSNFKGKIVTIKNVWVDNSYSIKECGFIWTDEMFEPVFKVGDKVKLRDDLKVEQVYGKLHFTRGMSLFKGRTLTIKNFTDTNNVNLGTSEGYVFSPEMLELVTTETTEIKEIKMEGNMKFEIKDYKVDEEKKTVVIFFTDGDVQKAKACDGDTYDFERGLEVCVMKHICGAEDKYRKVLKIANDQIIAINKAKEEAEKRAEIKARKKEKRAEKRRLRAERKRAARVSEMKEAYLAALKEYNGNIDFEEK